MDWQSEFLDLFMSGSVQNYSAALDLKRANIPLKLYRYRSMNNVSFVIDEICTGEIYLAHPKELNDPFDSCSLMKSDQPAHYFTDQSVFRQSLREHFSDEFLNQVFKSKDWYNELMRLVAQESTSPENYKQAFQALVRVVMDELLDVNKAFNQMVHNTSRLACFTTKFDNLPMWSHYALNHSGVCLEYESKSITNVYMLNRLFPVYYSAVLPDMVERSIGKVRPEFGIMDYFLIHKLEDWAYESEWRLIYNVGSWYFGLNEVPEEFWTQGKKIQFIRPSRVLLGARISAEHEKLIRDTCGYYSITAVKMECSEYGLRECCN